MERGDHVSARQMSILLFAFMTGSSIIFVPGLLIGFAGRGAWLSLVIAFPASLVMLACILYLHRRHADKTYVEMSRFAVGKTAGAMLAVLFALYLLVMVTWITMGISDFMNSTSMRNTPPSVFNVLILATAAMTVRAGFEVMTRISVLQIMMLLFFVISILLLSIPNYNAENLLPLIPDNFLPVAHGAYFVFGFPFAEVVVFAMLLDHARPEAYPQLRIGLPLAALANTLVLAFSTASAILVFGSVAADMKYSLFGVSRMIDIAEFLQRIESVIGISLIAGSYIKATIALFALNKLVSRLLRLQDEKTLTLPLAAVCFLLSVVMFENDGEFVENFVYSWPLLNIVCIFVPLLLVTALTAARRGSEG